MALWLPFLFFQILLHYLLSIWTTMVVHGPYCTKPVFFARCHILLPPTIFSLVGSSHTRKKHCWPLTKSSITSKLQWFPVELLVVCWWTKKQMSCRIYPILILSCSHIDCKILKKIMIIKVWECSFCNWLSSYHSCFLMLWWSFSCEIVAMLQQMLYNVENQHAFW